MKKQYTLLLLCAFYFSNLHSLFAQATFENAYWDSTSWFVYGLGFVQPTFEGGYALFGQSADPSVTFQEQFCLIKLHANGDVQWAKHFGDSIRDWGYAFSQTSDSGYIMVGQEYDWFAQQQPIFLYVIKCDKEGNLQWSNYYDMNRSGRCVLQTPDGGYIIAGNNTADVSFILKTDSLGNPEWGKTFIPTHFNDLQKTVDNGYILTGSTEFPDYTYGNVNLIKVDSAGNLQWSKTFGGAFSDEAQRVKQTADHGYVLAGTTNSFGESQGDIYLLKTDENGNLQWSMTYGNSNANSAYDVNQTEDGGYAIAALNNPGQTNIYLLKTDSAGNLQWSKQLGAWDNTFVEDMLVSSGSTFLISGNGQNFIEYPRLYLSNIDTDDCLIQNVEVTTTTVSSFDTTGGIADSSVSFTAHPAGAHEYAQQVLKEVLCAAENMNEAISTEPSFQIYPNPVSSQLNISFNNYHQPYYLVVTNFLGEIMRDEMITESESNIDVSQLLPPKDFCHTKFPSPFNFTIQ